MSFLDSIGNAFSDAADVVGDVAKDAVKFGEGAIDIAGNVAKDMAESTIDGLKHTFDSPMSVLKAAAFATILSPISLGVTLYELGDDIYKETDKEISKK